MLIFPSDSLSYAANGLLLWFNCMVPALFPFMILSGILIRQNLTEVFTSFIHPFIGRLYKISRNGTYCFVLGFLCGFPMGANVIGKLYESHKISKEEATYLLSFCNNIGPVYFISYLLPIIGLSSTKMLPFTLFGMYGIPLLYGLFLRYGKLPFQKKHVINTPLSIERPITEPFSESLDKSMQSAIYGITKLGGYMILFNLLNVIPKVICKLIPFLSDTTLLPIINCIFEITGGVKSMGTNCPYLVLTLLPFGGFSCIAQTKCMIKDTDLSVSNYVLHKLIQTFFTGIYYFLLFFFL